MFPLTDTILVGLLSKTDAHVYGNVNYVHILGCKCALIILIKSYFILTKEESSSTYFLDCTVSFDLN